jgi:hypothetical protein
MAAMENPRIRAYSVDATEFPELADQYNVSAVPLTVIKGQSEITFAGRYPEARFLAELLKAVTT